jgi:hypothetical protein
MGAQGSLEAADIPHVYVTGDAAYSHILLSFGEQDVLLVVILDHAASALHGYYRLSLRKEFDLD